MDKHDIHIWDKHKQAESQKNNKHNYIDLYDKYKKMIKSKYKLTKLLKIDQHDYFAL